MRWVAVGLGRSCLTVSRAVDWKTAIDGANTASAGNLFPDGYGSHKKERTLGVTHHWNWMISQGMAYSCRCWMRLYTRWISNVYEIIVDFVEHRALSDQTSC